MSIIIESIGSSFRVFFLNTKMIETAAIKKMPTSIGSQRISKTNPTKALPYTFIEFTKIQKIDTITLSVNINFPVFALFKKFRFSVIVDFNVKLSVQHSNLWNKVVYSKNCWYWKSWRNPYEKCFSISLPSSGMIWCNLSSLGIDVQNICRSRVIACVK